MIDIIEKIQESETLERYIEKQTGFTWKKEGTGKDLSECPICGGHECFKLAPAGFVKCFQCNIVAFDIIQFRGLYENISWKEAVKKFAEELGIKKYNNRDVDIVGIRETACEIGQDILYTCQTKYLFRDEKFTPLHYLIDYRKHTYEALSYFRIGFNDGTLIEKLKKIYSEEIIKSSGLMIIQDGIFMYPFIADGEIKYFRLKDPNKIKKFQMPIVTRGKNAIWYNQDCVKNGEDVICCEGEDDVISLWEAGENAIASCGNLTTEQINFLKKFNINTIFSCFDLDPEGERNLERLVKNYDNTDIFVIRFSKDKKDIDEVLRDANDKSAIVKQLKIKASIPSPEFRSLIKQKDDGYFILTNCKGILSEKRLTNWIGIVEAIIIKEEGLRERKVKIKRGKYENIVFMDGSVLSNASRFREFLLNNCNETCLFQGTDNDLNALVQYWGIAYNPIIIKETECVGEIDEGFIADNVFISNENEIKPLIDGYLMLDNKRALKIAELFTQAGKRSEIPYYPLIEPIEGINNFKKNVFNLMVKNRNLKVAIAIGWFKACLWSKMFYGKNKFFPLLMIHGKKESGKTVLCGWLMSMIGLGNAHAVSLREHGTTGVGIERKLAYLSSLPVWADDYRNREGEGQKFHGFFRNVFDRSSAPKGLRTEMTKIRQVVVRGCLVIDGETATNDAGLNSRLITFEITQQERNDNYYNEILKLEPNFACIGFDWVKHRIDSFPIFEANYSEINRLFRQKIASPRQAQVWAVAVASALTEPYFAKGKEKLCEYAIRLANYEIEQQKQEEIIGILWEAVDILHKAGKLEEQVAFHRIVDKDYKKMNQLEIHLPMLLGKINGELITRKYELPSNREVAKILKQEPYCLGWDTTRVDGKVAGRWILDLNSSEIPDTLRHIFCEKSEKQEKQQDWTDL